MTTKVVSEDLLLGIHVGDVRVARVLQRRRRVLLADFQLDMVVVFEDPLLVEKVIETLLGLGKKPFGFTTEFRAEDDVYVEVHGERNVIDEQGIVFELLYQPRLLVLLLVDVE